MEREPAGSRSSPAWRVRLILIHRLSADLPLVIEVVDSQEHLDRVLPEVDRMMHGGLITMEKVRVLKYEEPKRRN